MDPKKLNKEKSQRNFKTKTKKATSRNTYLHSEGWTINLWNFTNQQLIRFLAKTEEYDKPIASKTATVAE